MTEHKDEDDRYETVTFRVLAKTEELEAMRISGDCAELGQWDANRSVEMRPLDGVTGEVTGETW